MSTPLPLRSKLAVNHQIKLLHQAIDQATGPGHCLYVEHNQPACVIAQYATLNGTSLHQLRTWTGSIDCVPASNVCSAPPLTEWLPLDILLQIQRLWDTFACAPTPDFQVYQQQVQDRRQIMHQALHAWEQGTYSQTADQ